PIDVRFGPDGDLYIADWSNPIIQHGEVGFRDARRDKEHGRIWRVALTAGSGQAKPGTGSQRDLTKLPVTTLLDLTLSPSGGKQERARRVLRPGGGGGVLDRQREWLPRQSDPRAKLEVVWLHAAFDEA